MQLHDEFTGQTPTSIYRKNYEENDFSERSPEFYQLALSPFAITRVQKTIVECIPRGILNIQDTEWNISIIERDVPCGYLAIEDLQQMMMNLFLLKGVKLDDKKS